MKFVNTRIARATRGLALAFFVAVSLVPMTGRAEAVGAAAPIQSFYSSLLDTMQHGAALGQKGRYEKLAPVIARTFDISYMARMAVGRFWPGLSDAQRQAVTTAFGRYVAASWADRFDSYSGEKLQVGGTKTGSYGTIVQTTIVKSDGGKVSIDYLMRQDGDRWQISDVYLTGTISELATRRAEFTAVLERKGIDGLIETLNHKANLLVASNQP